MTPDAPKNPHSEIADALHEGRPVEANKVRGARPGARILVLLIASGALAAGLLIGMWVVSNRAFASQNDTPVAAATTAQSFSGDAPGQTMVPAADAPTSSTGQAMTVPTGQTPNVNAPTQPSN